MCYRKCSLSLTVTDRWASLLCSLFSATSQLLEIWILIVSKNHFHRMWTLCYLNCFLEVIAFQFTVSWHSYSLNLELKWICNLQLLTSCGVCVVVSSHVSFKLLLKSQTVDFLGLYSDPEASGRLVGHVGAARHTVANTQARNQCPDQLTLSEPLRWRSIETKSC